MFTWLIVIIILQRLIELFIARKNEAWMMSQGGVEVGQSHYRYMVILHICFFISLLLEVFFFNRTSSSAWPILLIGFIFTQIGRVWVILSLGRYWNTKIIVLPQANVVKKGPYQFLKHPNYVIVSLELIIIPLMFQAYFTAVLFTLLNILILSIRIPAEEKALLELTEYGEVFSKQKRFLPSFSKRV
ncbi:isoprenylcysteine carboxylmethyltransferase family protein [Bacillaceae bacterium CLA-AA-H227]|uniref:Isoprenylcysteine carboxylmethyltransferase family protein n=1 Tax=Robertmurraya yapensis (ex Hitch et al 2024) TaxID=3133160 RepID=A0ACC6SF81_9BACI